MGKTILIVDDSRTVAMAAKLALEAQGFRALMTSSFLELATVVDKESPSVVVLDLNMPSVSGEQVAGFLQRHDFAGQIVIYSSAEENELKRKAEELKAFAYVKKDADLQPLVNAVVRADDMTNVDARATGSSNGSAPVRVEDIKGKSLLLVDDDPAQHELVRSLFQDTDLRVLSAESAWIGLLIRKETPDLVLLDLDLGGMRTGIDAIVSLETFKVPKRPKIVLYSVQPVGELEVLAQKHGLDGVIAKGIGPSELRDRILKSF